jgi:RNA polymerase sigma-70 factor, ECF subfamily
VLAPDSDDDLITRSARGDPRAFERLVERHAPAVLRLARAMSANDAAADDVVQDTFLSAFRAAGTYTPGRAAVRTWLFAIARNAARRARRGRRETPVEEETLVELGVAAGWGAPPSDSPDRHDALARALASLEEDDREILVLRDLEELPGDAAAALLGIGLAAMKSRLHRARLRLLAALRAEEEGVVENEREVGGLSCSAVLTRLGDYVDGELAAEEVARVEAHLRGCHVCERFGGRYAHVVKSARARLGAPPALDTTKLDRLRAALRG